MCFSWVTPGSPPLATSIRAGVRESAAENKIKAAHKKIMIANHPDSGGSSFIATKVNEAKDMLLGKRKSGSNIF